MSTSENLMHNGNKALSKRLASCANPEEMADRIIRLEAGFALIMKAYDEGDLRHTVASTIFALFPKPTQATSSLLPCCSE